MKVAITSSGNDLNSQIDPRFGRCAYFLVVDPDDMSCETFSNDSAVLGGGAGIQSAQFLASKGVAAVITGNCGPNAVQALSSAEIDLFVGQTGTVKEAVERFRKGELRPSDAATVDNHYGMAAAFPTGSGRGAFGGGGMRPGIGGGRGKGQKMGMGRVMGGDGQSTQRSSKRLKVGERPVDSELEILKKKADDIKKQLNDVISRIKMFESND
jgi:predicted Fe-Mo cluster-binding NifX family protein